MARKRPNRRALGVSGPHVPPDGLVRRPRNLELPRREASWVLLSEVAADYPSLPDRVVEELRKAIINGVIPAGEHLVETDLASRLGVSRTTVRHALTRLHAQGLVEPRPRRGCVVTRLTSEQASDVKEARALLEGVAARDCAGRLSGQEADAMRRVAAEMAQALAGGDIARLVDLDIQFHHRVVDRCHNRRIAGLFTVLDGQMGALLSATLATAVRTPRQVRAHHDAVIDALERGGPDAAEEAVRLHYVGDWADLPEDDS